MIISMFILQKKKLRHRSKVICPKSPKYKIELVLLNFTPFAIHNRGDINDKNKSQYNVIKVVIAVYTRYIIKSEQGVIIFWDQGRLSQVGI